MKKDGCLNYDLEYFISRLGHTQTMVICDAGLPIPEGANLIDLALVPGLPSFLDVLKVVSSELVVESYTYAEETIEKNKRILDGIGSILDGKKNSVVSHEELKLLSLDAEVFVRTGECSPYANIILTAGVSF